MQLQDRVLGPSGSNDGIPAQVPERIALVHEHRRILDELNGSRAPGGGWAEACDYRTGNVRPQKCLTRERGVGCVEFLWITGLSRFDQRKLPPFLQAVAFER